MNNCFFPSYLSTTQEFFAINFALYPNSLVLSRTAVRVDPHHVSCKTCTCWYTDLHKCISVSLLTIGRNTSQYAFTIACPSKKVYRNCVARVPRPCMAIRHGFDDVTTQLLSAVIDWAVATSSCYLCVH